MNKINIWICMLLLSIAVSGCMKYEDPYKDAYEKFKAQSEANKAEGEKFLAENKTKPGVVETASGLQYLILKADSGALPTINSVVTTHYHGTFIDGNVFDSSVARGTPAEFGISQVIQGWTEALQMMPVGSKWRLFIPPHLAYGENGRGSIGPNKTLIFEVELLGIK